MSFYFLDHFVIFWGYVFQCLVLECITSKALAVCYSIFMFFYFHIILFLRYSIFMSFYFLDHFVIFWGYAFQCLALECITSKPLAVYYSIFRSLELYVVLFSRSLCDPTLAVCYSIFRSLNLYIILFSRSCCDLLGLCIPMLSIGMHNL